MTALGKFSLRLALYGLFIAYLLGDLFVFNGPIRRKVDSARPGSPQAIAAAKANGAVARVFHHPITRGQLDRAVHDRLWLEGKSWNELPAAEQKLVRYAALGDLIDHQLLRMKVKVNTAEVAVTDEEVTARFEDIASRFDSPETMEAAMKSQAIGSARQLRERLAARLQQEKYVELKIGEAARVTEEEAETWYAENQQFIAYPERIEARHLLIPTLNIPAEEARATLEAALTSLKEKSADFATLAKQLSQDPATKDHGGSLG